MEDQIFNVFLFLILDEDQVKIYNKLIKQLKCFKMLTYFFLSLWYIYQTNT